MLTFGYAPREITLIVLVSAAATAAVAWFAGLWALIPALVGLALLAFFRDPPRRIPDDPRAVLAPADGKVVAIDREATVEGLDGPALRIMIFLSVFDVHVNRSPCAGNVSAVHYRPGEFLNALRPEADLRNEANALVLAPDPPFPGPVRVRQIAGILARRIVCTARPGDRLAAGARFGMIKLGSRTEVCLPEDARWQICVQRGDRVRAGCDVLVRLRSETPQERHDHQAGQEHVGQRHAG